MNSQAVILHQNNKMKKRKTLQTCKLNFLKAYIFIYIYIFLFITNNINGYIDMKTQSNSGVIAILFFA